MRAHAEYSAASRHGANGYDDARAQQARIEEALRTGGRRLRKTWARDARARSGVWRVRGVLPASGVCILYGGIQGGKTFCAIDAGLRMASGMDVFGRKTEPCAVIYCCAEDHDGVEARVAAWLRHHQKEDQDIPFLLLNVEGWNLSAENTDDAQRLLAEIEEERAVLREIEGGLPPGAIVFDTLSACAPAADLNTGPGMGPLLAMLKRFATELGVLAIGVHHEGKSTSYTDDRAMAGHFSLRAGMDASIEVRQDKETETHTVWAHKIKNGPNNFLLGQFRRKRVLMGREEDGEPILPAVAVYEPTPSATMPNRRKVLSAHAQGLFDAIQNTESRKGRPPPDHIREHVPAKASVVTRAEVKSEAERLDLSQWRLTEDASKTEKDRKRKAQSELYDLLRKERLIGTHAVSPKESYVWVIKTGS